MAFSLILSSQTNSGDLGEWEDLRPGKPEWWAPARGQQIGRNGAAVFMRSPARESGQTAEEATCSTRRRSRSGMHTQQDFANVIVVGGVRSTSHAFHF